MQKDPYTLNSKFLGLKIIPSFPSVLQIQEWVWKVGCGGLHGSDSTNQELEGTGLLNLHKPELCSQVLAKRQNKTHQVANKNKQNKTKWIRSRHKDIGIFSGLSRMLSPGKVKLDYQYTGRIFLVFCLGIHPFTWLLPCLKF